MTRTRIAAVSALVLFTPALAWAATEAPDLCASICALFGCGGC